MTSNYQEWSRLVTKEAGGIDDSHFGKVKDVKSDYVLCNKTLEDKDKMLGNAN
jgi:hypothetical protein